MQKIRIHLKCAKSICMECCFSSASRVLTNLINSKLVWYNKKFSLTRIKVYKKKFRKYAKSRWCVSWWLNIKKKKYVFITVLSTFSLTFSFLARPCKIRHLNCKVEVFIIVLFRFSMYIFEFDGNCRRIIVLVQVSDEECMIYGYQK